MAGNHEVARRGASLSGFRGEVLRLKVVTVCAGALAAVACSGPVVILSGSTAYADGINVSPTVARRGDSVTVTGGCQGGVKTPDTWASLTSPVLVPTGSNINSGGFSLTTTVRDSARFGHSTITVTCNNSKNQYRASIFIKPGKRFLDDEWPHNPDRWPHTGGGGMANVAQATHGASVGAVLSGIAWPAGLALLGGAAGIGAFTTLRSRARAARGRG